MSFAQYQLASHSARTFPNDFDVVPIEESPINFL
jgi:hypothetical protein